MDGNKPVNGMSAPGYCSVKRRNAFSDMQQMAKITARSAEGYLREKDLFQENNLDPQIKGKLEEFRNAAEELELLIGKRAA